MARTWLSVAQCAAIVTLAACGSSHERTGMSGADGGAAPDATARRDGGAPGDAGGPIDAGALDAGPRGACDPEDATAELCPEVLCDGPGTWHWDGERCFYADCGACRGDDCTAGALSLDECEAAHASCKPSLCRATDGRWMWWAESCGDYECGQPPPEVCESPYPGCDCGLGRSYFEGTGCADDPRCPEFDPLPSDVLCTTTGGTWGPFCCHTTCGVPCPAACLADACDCGPERNFDPARGCIVDPVCLERAPGDTCEGRARCQPGTVCCMNCGGAGCVGPAVCEYPTCDDDPATDICGNNTLAP